MLATEQRELSPIGWPRRDNLLAQGRSCRQHTASYYLLDSDIDLYVGF